MNNNQGLTPNLPLWSFQIQSDSKLALNTRKDLEIHLITRALKNEDFKQELIANPKAVIEEELGTQLPEDLEIKVLEETEDTIYMVLPCTPYEGISEEELQASLGMTYEDVAQWVLEQQRNTLLDENSSVELMAHAWQDEAFKQELLSNPMTAIVQSFGEKFPLELGSITILGLGETNNKLYIVLPSAKDESSLSKMTMPVEQGFINQPIMVGSHGGDTSHSCGNCSTGCNSCHTRR